MRKQNLSPARKKLLCTLIGSSLFWQLPAYAAEPTAEQAQETAWETAADTAGQHEFTLEGVEVTAERDKALPPAYAGGQVARGARVGLLGNKDFIDTPFQLTAYTAQFIEERQASTLRDLLVSDPGVRGGDTRGGFYQSFLIRGNTVSENDISLNGMTGMGPSGRAALEFIERVEVQKGPNALLNGMFADGSVGGAISLTTKQASDEPITRLTTTWESDGKPGVHLDLGRRLGDNQEFGFRFNGVYSDGDTRMDGQSEANRLAALNLDYRRGSWRFALDAYTIKDKANGGLSPYFSFDSPTIPAAPDNSVNFFPLAYSKLESEGLMFRTEYDVGNHGTLYAGVGTANTHRSHYTTNMFVNDTLGNATVWTGRNNDVTDKKAYVLGYNGTGQTGAIKHQLALQFNHLQYGYRTAYNRNTYQSNIYHPTAPEVADLADLGSPRKSSEKRLSSLALADTLSFPGDKVQLTAGLRRQNVHTKSFNITTGAQTSKYNESAVTPSLALVVKPWQAPVSLYANYIEGLQAGETVSDTAASNYGHVFAPYKTKQYEAGVKWDAGTFAHTFSAYRIFKPSMIKETTDSIITYTDQGQQRSSGLEWSFFGKLNANTRLLGGAAFNRAVQMKATDATLIGKTVTSTPKWAMSLGVEWDTSWQPNLTLSLRTVYTGRQYHDSANTLQYPSWIRYDLGARYKTTVGKTPVTVNATVENLFDKNYWTGQGGSLGQPRTLKLSATMEF